MHAGTTHLTTSTCGTMRLNMARDSGTLSYCFDKHTRIPPSSARAPLGLAEERRSAYRVWLPHDRRIPFSPAPLPDALHLALKHGQAPGVRDDVECRGRRVCPVCVEQVGGEEVARG
jgi:hypothetical protein